MLFFYSYLRGNINKIINDLVEGSEGLCHQCRDHFQIKTLTEVKFCVCFTVDNSF